MDSHVPVSVHGDLVSIGGVGVAHPALWCVTSARRCIAGVCSCLIGLSVCVYYSHNLMVSPNDIFLGFLAGFFQVGFGFIFITIGARTTPSAMVGIIMLSESVLGPVWAFLFAGERVSLFTLIGGAIILFAVLLQFSSLLLPDKRKNY